MSKWLCIVKNVKVKWKKFGLILFFATAFLVPRAYSQSHAIPDTLNEIWFDKIIGIENSGIINGPEYKMELIGTSSHPFLDRRDVIGTVQYQHASYQVPLLYDIYKDEIIVKHFSASGRGWFVQLDKRRVQEFVIQGRRFRNFPDGFHEIIYECDQFLVVAKREVVDEVTRGLINYVKNDRYFIVESNRWKPLVNTGSFGSLLSAPAEKKELQSFVRQNKIKIRNFRNEDLAKVAGFVNSLRTKKQ
jgi:hypothetical protein